MRTPRRGRGGASKRLHVIGITGSPGTGKKTVGTALAGRLELPFFEINSVAAGIADDEGWVDPRALRKRLLKVVPARSVVVGHLLPDVLNRSEVEFVAVLRCEPRVLRKRLAERGYSGEKLIQNLEAELIGVLVDSSVKKFGRGRVREYDTSKTSPRDVADRIAREIVGGEMRPRRWIDWTLAYDSPTKFRSIFSEDAGPGST